MQMGTQSLAGIGALMNNPLFQMVLKQSQPQDAAPTSEISQLVELLKSRSDEDRRQREQMQQQQAVERQSSEMGRLTDAQAANVLSRGSTEGRLGALSTMSLVDRRRKLKAAGMDPDASWVRSMLGAQRPGESDEAYIARARMAQAEYDKQHNTAVERARAKGAAAKAAKGDRMGYAAGVRAIPGQDQNARGRGLVQGSIAPTQEGDVGLAGQWMDNPDRLPPTPTQYQSVVKPEDAPTQFGQYQPTIGDARAEGNSLLSLGADARRRALEQLLAATY